MKFRMLTLLCALSICSPGYAEVTQGVSDNTIKIGSVADLSGPLASWGVASTNGIRMRFDEANHDGGIHGRQINYIVEDMAYKLPEAIAAANKLITADKVFALIGNTGTPPNNAIMKIVINSGVPNLFPLSAGLSMSEPPHPLRLPFLLNDRDTMRGAVKYFADRGVQRICYELVTTDHGTEVEAGIRAEAEKLGLIITATGKHRQTETDFTATVTKFRNSGCEALFMATVARDATQVYTAARAAKWDVPIVSSLGALVPSVAENPAMEGFYTAAPFHLIDFKDIRSTQPEVAAWADRYRSLFGHAPSPQAVIGYTMADITVLALEEAGRDLTVPSFMDAIQNIDVYKDPFGGPDVTMKGATHLGPKFSVLSQVRGGQWIVAAPSLEF
ncbi:ABC transporter substrate-binding protein [Castellaniella sp.]|uniref:ABC transporter substrate-binding protein n=1 Tax=Castellaniella sp. TaxID=1955812 RepID=UPI00355DE3A4